MHKSEMETNSREWRCSDCRFENKVIHWNARKQVPVAKCRCCGANKDEAVPMPLTSVPFEKTVDLDMRIKTEWDELILDIEQNPKGNQCDAGGVMIDSCPMIQKFFLMMKYYHIHIGKAVVDMDDKEEYCIKRMTDLVENLQGLSVIRLVDMFEHISTVHRDQATFDHFIEGIGKCDEGDECPTLLRNRERSHAQRLEESSDAVEQQTLLFFAKWHSFLFHPRFVDNVVDSDFPEEQKSADKWSAEYVDYRFGVWIDYTAHSPSFECMKEEMMENEIYSLTLEQWQSTLMDALTHLDSDKVKMKDRYTAKRKDTRYGIEKGQKIGALLLLSSVLHHSHVL